MESESPILRRVWREPFSGAGGKACSKGFVRVRSIFSCVAAYLRIKTVPILRDKREEKEDIGVWLATAEECHQSLRRLFPNMNSIRVFRNEVKGWQFLPADAQSFEGALCACKLVRST